MAETVSIRPGRRLAAAMVDGAAALLVTVLLASTVGLFWAERAVVTFHIEDPESIWKGLGPMLMGLTAPVSYGFALGLALILLSEALFGVSPGKMVTRSAIRGADGGAPDRARLVRRFQVKTAWILLYLVALGTGFWQILVPAVLAAVAVAVGGLGMFGPAGRTLHDRLARTAVLRT